MLHQSGNEFLRREHGNASVAGIMVEWQEIGMIQFRIEKLAAEKEGWSFGVYIRLGYDVAEGSVRPAEAS